MDERFISILLPGVAFSILFGWYTRRKNALSLDGALTAAFSGLWVLWFAGPFWLLPLFFFFITSTLFGKLVKKQSLTTDAKHGQPRDYRQVLCNGGIYTLLATWAEGPYREQVLLLMSLSIAVSTADTWSSEVGQYFRQKTWDILRWKPLPAGLSGGVSRAGTLAGLAGALAMAMVCDFLMDNQPGFAFIQFVAVGGFAGMLLDSFLGAGFQARYQNSQTGALSDQPTANGQLVSGFSWMSNDAVNFWSNVLATGGGGVLIFW